MDMRPFLKRIETRLAELGMTASAASKQATNSRDTIRNWQRAATENPLQGAPRLDKIEAIASVLQVTPEWLLNGTTGDAPTGFSEIAIHDFQPRDDQPMQAAAVAAILSRDPNLTAQVIERDHPELMIGNGDVAICDPRNPTPAPGALVICNHVDEQGVATRIIRRYAPPWLVGGGQDGLPRAVPLDRANVALNVVALLRSKP